MSEEHGARLGRVESEVSSIKQDVAKLEKGFTNVQADVRNLGNILSRIEQGVVAQGQRFDNDKQATRVSPVAVVTIIITVLSMMVGGSWLISGSLATTSIRLDENDKQTGRLIELRNREFDMIQRRIDRLEDGKRT